VTGVQGEPSPAQQKRVRIATSIDAGIYRKIWEMASKRFDKPGRKVYLIIEEALKEYIEKHG